MAPPPAQHLEDFVTHTVPYAFQVDRYRAVKFVVGDFRHRTLGRLDAGIVQCGIPNVRKSLQSILSFLSRSAYSTRRNRKTRHVSLGHQTFNLAPRLLMLRKTVMYRPLQRLRRRRGRYPLRNRSLMLLFLYLLSC